MKGDKVAFGNPDVVYELGMYLQTSIFRFFVQVAAINHTHRLIVPCIRSCYVRVCMFTYSMHAIIQKV